MDIVHGMMALRKFDDADVLFFLSVSVFFKMYFLLINK